MFFYEKIIAYIYSEGLVVVGPTSESAAMWTPPFQWASIEDKVYTNPICLGMICGCKLFCI